MPETSLKNQIKRLIELQKVDEQIYNLKKELSEKPLEIEKLRIVFESKKTKLNEFENKAKQIQLKRKELELELKIKEEDVAKANKKLSELKTNKEYTAMISEIERIRADKSIIEEKILNSFDESDVLGVEIDKEKKIVNEAEIGFSTKQSQVQTQVHAAQDQVKVLELQRKQVLPDIDKIIIDRYERILQHKQGKAIVSIHGNTCGGCFMNVTAQTINLIKIGASLVECEMCSRILYLEETF